MSHVLQLLLADNLYKKIEEKYGYYRRNKASAFAAVCIILGEIVSKLFLRLESDSWQKIRANLPYWFPHISLEHPRPGDIVRFLFQGIGLVLFFPERKKRKTPKVCSYFKNALNSYYSQIQRLSGELKDNPRMQNLSHCLSELGNPLSRWLFILLSLLALVLLVICITQPFKPTAQFIFVILLWVMAMSIRKVPGHMSTIMLIVLSVIVSCRYLWWRYAYTLVWDDSLSAFFGTLLIIAETYIWLVMVLGYFQSIWPLHRKPVALPKDDATWPTVDIMITTYDEALGILKPGVYSALGLDWPKEKLNIYILDDGDRPEFKAFADEVGVHYLARPTHEHAKAGNINYALQHSRGELVAFFDCDFVIAHSFLKLTVGWFLKTPKLAILQTPHHFFSPDPFERNLKSFRVIPNESALFYGVVQDGNDAWNATYFCGSAGLMRRTALEHIGGIAVESVTEDAHTSLRLQRAGYDSAYIQIPLAAGLATGSLAGHIGQRIRWARGMAQILRLDNPLFGKGLSIGQRLCYFNSMLHFLSGIPRLIFFITPAAFLALNASIVYASGVMILLYAIPHIVHAVLTNDRIQGKFRHFLWNEIYETVMAWYIAIPTTVALIRPDKGRFNVTAKGSLIEQEYVDWRTARPYIILLAINIIGLLALCVRLFIDPAATMIADCITAVWTFFNLLILGGSLGVSIETQQRRRSPRVRFSMPAILIHQNKTRFPCTLIDYSDHGIGIQMEGTDFFKTGEAITLLLKHNQKEFSFPGVIAHKIKDNLGIFLNEFSLQQNIDFIQCTFARAEIWALWQKEIPQDKPLQSMHDVLELDFQGYLDIIKYTPSMLRHILAGISKAAIWISSFIPRRPKKVNRGYHRLSELESYLKNG